MTKWWKYIKHNVGYPSKGKYAVGGFQSDSLTEIRKVAMDEATYNVNHDLRESIEIKLSSNHKIVEWVWYGYTSATDRYEYLTKKKDGSKGILSEKTGKITKKLN